MADELFQSASISARRFRCWPSSSSSLPCRQEMASVHSERIPYAPAETRSGLANSSFSGFSFPERSCRPGVENQTLRPTENEVSRIRVRPRYSAEYGGGGCIRRSANS